MQLTIYAVYDDIAQVYNTPFYMHNDGMAIRAFKGHVNGAKDSAIYDFPEQFKLYKLGTFNDSNGRIEVYDPIYVAHGQDVKEDTLEVQDRQVIYELTDRLRKLEAEVFEVVDPLDVAPAHYHVKPNGEDTTNA